MWPGHNNGDGVPIAQDEHAVVVGGEGSALDRTLHDAGDELSAREDQDQK